MKTTVLLMLACACIVAAFAVPGGSWGASSEAAEEQPAVHGETLAVNVDSAHACRLVVVPGEGTRTDRGSVTSLELRHAFEGSFRYWQEPVGRVLYVWDDTQNLVTRVINPERVVLLDARP